MLTYGLAFVALFVSDFIANLLTLPIHSLDKTLQWVGKSPEEWQALGVDSPAERLTGVSFTTGLACTLVTRLVGFWVAARVFEWRDTEMSAPFIVGVGAALLLSDAARVMRFLGNPGVWTELGYAVGGLAAAMIVLLY